MQSQMLQGSLLYELGYNIFIVLATKNNVFKVACKCLLIQMTCAVRHISCLDTNTLSYQNITFHIIVKPIHDTHIIDYTDPSKTMFTSVLLIIAFTLGYIYANTTHNNTSQSWTIMTTATNHPCRCQNSHTAILVIWIHRSCHAQVCFTQI